jgi:uncharacterized membrane protein YebE (DUF533 family)
MSFGNILGQILQQGIGAQSQTRSRADASAQNIGTSGGSMGSILTQLQGALGGASGAGTGGAQGAGTGGPGFGGMAERARQFLGQEQIGGMSNAKIGGLGAAAGALFGGGLEGAARGGALAMLGTMALTAWRESQAKNGGAVGVDATPQLEQQEIDAVTSPETERLLLRAMISAAKADGAINQTEMRKILGKVGDDGVTPEEKAFVMDEMQTPIDIQALVAQVRHPAQAAEVYAASLLAIDIDTDAERRYLRELAATLDLNAETVTKLHQMTGAPIV